MDDLLVGTTLGLAYAVAPGPLNVETIRRALHEGRRSATALQLGALLGDGALALLALLGAGFLAQQPGIHLLLGIVGVGLLLFLGLSSLHAVWQSHTRRCPHLPCDTRIWDAGQPGRMLHNAVVGCMMALANPLGMAFWLSLCGTTPYHTHQIATMLLAGFFLGLAVWAISLPLVLGWSQSLLRGGVFEWVSMLAGMSLVAFGVLLGRTLLAV